MEKTIGEIKKTNTVVTKVRLTEFKGKQLIDIRDWFKPKNNNDYAPTKKGITLNISKEFIMPSNIVFTYPFPAFFFSISPLS